MSKDSPAFDEQLSIAFVECRIRCLVLGGVACNVYGSTRMSEDTDIWLDPTRGPEAWLHDLRRAIQHCGVPCQLVRLRDQSVVGDFHATNREPVFRVPLRDILEEDAVVRLQNESGKLDVFYRVNRLDDFEMAWQRSTTWDEPLRVLSIPDLVETKKETGRKKDRVDIEFLETLLKS